MIRWLIGPTIASAIFAFVAIRIFDVVFSSVTGTVTSIARPALFTGTWSATTAASGMRGFNSRVQKIRSVRDKIRNVVAVGDDSEPKGARDD